MRTGRPWGPWSPANCGERRERHLLLSQPGAPGLPGSRDGEGGGPGLVFPKGGHMRGVQAVWAQDPRSLGYLEGLSLAPLWTLQPLCQRKALLRMFLSVQRTRTRPEAGGQALNPALSDSALPSAGSPMDSRPQAQPHSPFPLPSPRQSGLEQYLRSWLGPPQPWLPGAGDGRTHWRLRVRVPSPPQEREHGPHGPQGLKPSAALEQSPTEQDSCPCTQELGKGHGGEGLGRTDLERKGGQGSPPQRVKGQSQGSQAGQGRAASITPSLGSKSPPLSPSPHQFLQSV